MVRLTIIFSSRSVKYPCGRYLVLVCDGALGIIQKEAMPIHKVNKPLRRMFSADPITIQHLRYSLDEEHPSPARVAGNPSHLQQSHCGEVAAHCGEVILRVKEGHSNGKIVLVVEVG